MSSLENKKRALGQLLQELKDRFRSEYLGLLVQRGKEKQTREYKVGEMVFVERDGQKRIFWPMARITELIPGGDGEPRVARLKTKNGELIRTLQRLYPLEVSQEETLHPVLQEKRTVVTSQPHDVPQTLDPVPQEKRTVVTSQPHDVPQTLDPVPQEKRTEVATLPQDVHPSPQLTTRGGRVVRKPIKYCDY
jgi:hypothetical protein